MGRHKNLENMTHKERCAYWEKKREKDAADRAALIAQMEEAQPQMIEAVRALISIAADVADDLQMDGVDNISVRSMHELMDTANETRNLFNAGE